MFVRLVGKTDLYLPSHVIAQSGKLTDDFKSIATPAGQLTNLLGHDPSCASKYQPPLDLEQLSSDDPSQTLRTLEPRLTEHHWILARTFLLPSTTACDANDVYAVLLLLQRNLPALADFKSYNENDALTWLPSQPFFTWYTQTWLHGHTDWMSETHARRLNALLLMSARMDWNALGFATGALIFTLHKHAPHTFEKLCEEPDPAYKASVEELLKS